MTSTLSPTRSTKKSGDGKEMKLIGSNSGVRIRVENKNESPAPQLPNADNSFFNKWTSSTRQSKDIHDHGFPRDQKSHRQHPSHTQRKPRAAERRRRTSSGTQEGRVITILPRRSKRSKKNRSMGMPGARKNRLRGLLVVGSQRNVGRRGGRGYSVDDNDYSEQASMSSSLNHSALVSYASRESSDMNCCVMCDSGAMIELCGQGENDSDGNLDYDDDYYDEEMEDDDAYVDDEYTLSDIDSVGTDSKTTEDVPNVNKNMDDNNTTKSTEQGWSYSKYFFSQDSPTMETAPKGDKADPTMYSKSLFRQDSPAAENAPEANNRAINRRRAWVTPLNRQKYREMEL